MHRVCAWLAASGLMFLVGAIFTEPSAATKRPPAVEPDLRIVQVTVSPDAYVPGSGALSLAVEVDLPTYLDNQLMLEVSSLISSPSKRSMRFLSQRQTLTVPTPNTDAHVTITLAWDGKDQHEQVVESGRYAYEVRAKLLSVGEKGPRTFMHSWPKRGTIEIK
jgi:hypothetical protein